MNTKFPFLLLLGGLLYGTDSFAQQPSASFVLTQQPCNANGIITANFANMTPPLTVTWQFPSGLPAVTHTNVASLSDALTGYTGAQCYILAQDANGLYADGYYQGAPPFSYQLAVTPGICPALSTATAVVTGGTAPYTYQWIDQASSSVISTANPAALPNGSYNLMVTDANGCSWGSLLGAPDSIFIHSEAPFNFTVNKTAANCTNGTATVAGIAGTGVPPYTYLWSNGATASAINSLTAGYYNVTVTDAQGCSRDRGVEVNQAVNIGANITMTPATCTQNDGSVIVFGSGGVPPYTYVWSNGPTTQSQSNLSAGSYNVVVTDANGCTGHGSSYVYASSPVVANYTATPSSCTAPTGSATLSVTGGQAPYAVSWSTFPAQTGMTASNLAPGSYTFTVTDANGCTRSGAVDVPPVNIISASITATQPVCTQSNGSLSVLATGGVAPYSYLWSNGGTSATVSGLAQGGYSVTVTDANGCSVTKVHSLNSSSPVGIGFTATNTSCIYASDGSIASTVWGGTAPYTYSWSTSPAQTTPAATGLRSGYYSLSVTDANGCHKTAHTYVNAGFGTACYCTITGTVYHDVNGNCVQDAGEPGVPNIQMHCNGFGYTYTDASGVYTFKVPSGSYTLSESVQAAHPLSACQNNNISITVTAAAGCTQTYDFANTVNPLHDIHISTWNYNQAVPGNQYHQKTIVKNEGTVPENNILGGYYTDGQLGSPLFVPSGIFTGTANPNWFSTAGNTFPGLAPAASQLFSTYYNVPTNIPMGTQVHFRDSAVYAAPMSSWVNDYSPWNNVCMHSATIVSSYDPNFKEVYPKGEGPEGNITHADSVLEYMVHFQNLGTYRAQHVVVIDTLDGDLDWSTLTPVYSSHPAKVEIDEHGVLKYTFGNINLPAEMHDPEGSNGMFTYTIKQKPDLALGTQIWNSAAIYFDYNEPVITNGVVNTLYKPTSADGPAAPERLSFVLYPNPTSDGFSTIIENKVPDAATLISVTDVSGRVLLTKNMQLQPGKRLVTMNTQSLPAGVYLVSLDIAGKKGTQKLVIVK